VPPFERKNRRRMVKGFEKTPSEMTMEIWDMHRPTNMPLQTLDRNEFKKTGDDFMKAGAGRARKRPATGRKTEATHPPPKMKGFYQPQEPVRPMSSLDRKAIGNANMRSPCGPPSILWRRYGEEVNARKPHYARLPINEGGKIARGGHVMQLKMGGTPLFPLRRPRKRLSLSPSPPMNDPLARSLPLSNIGVDKNSANDLIR